MGISPKSVSDYFTGEVIIEIPQPVKNNCKIYPSEMEKWKMDEKLKYTSNRYLQFHCPFFFIKEGY